jgi:hypothetical protein
MTDLGSPYPKSHVTPKELRPRDSAVIWLVTTLLFSLLPFLFLPIIYHSVHEPHQWPNLYNLIGHGDMALVVVAVLGATFAELVLPSRTTDTTRAILVAISAICGMISVTVYSIAQYQVLASQGGDIQTNTVILVATLILTVAIQCFFIVNRQIDQT